MTTSISLDEYLKYYCTETILKNWILVLRFLEEDYEDI